MSEVNNNNPSGTTTKSRKPTKPNLALVLPAIERGDYDDDLATIISEIQRRREKLEAALTKRVKDVFGSQAQIVRSPLDAVMNAGREHFERERQAEKANQQPARPNPFMDKAEESEDQEQVEDPLSSLDAVERQMATESPIERRGAEISGLHSSDIAD